MTTDKELLLGLNPYGQTYHLGIQASGTPRANPDGAGLEGFIELARKIGAKSIELHEPWLRELDDNGLDALGERLEALDLVPIIGSGLPHAPVGSAIAPATRIGAGTIRLALTTVLCGARAELGDDWPALVADVRARICRYAAMARDAGIHLAIENHQDFNSDELLELCDIAGGNVGICLDIANAFPVAEAPLDFARKVAHRVRHVHLKDYRVQFTDEGIRLVRCPIGDGAVPIREIVECLLDHRGTLTGSIELAALEARHVRFLDPGWWRFYPPVSGATLAGCLAAARRNRLADDADYRTPWETGDDHRIAAFELEQLERSAANMRALGYLGEGK